MPSPRHVMPIAILLAAGLVHGPLRAEPEAWAAFLATWRKSPRPPLTLLAPRGLVTFTYRASDEVLLRLVAAGDLGLDILEGPRLIQVQAARGWDGGPRWVLLDRAGKVLEEGGALPSGEALRAHLVASGATPTWDALEQFLDLQPDHGEALERRLTIACRMSATRFRALRERGLADGFAAATERRWPVFRPARAKDPSTVAGIAREVAETLRRVNGLPDAWRGGWGMFSFWLKTLGGLDEGGIRTEIRTFREGILSAWRQQPHTGAAFASEQDGAALGDLWLACAGSAGNPDDWQVTLSLSPVPSRPWPSHELLTQIFIQAMEGGHLQALLVLLDGLPAESRPGWDWGEWVKLRRSVLDFRVIALAELQRWSEAAAALQEQRRWSGAAWTEGAAFLLRAYGPEPAPAGEDRKAGPPKPGAAPQAFLDLLSLPPLEPPPAPEPRPLRFLVWGRPSWAGEWKTRRQQPPLCDWTPEELREETPAEADVARLGRAGLPVSGWAVFRGSAEVLTRGDGPPDPSRLAHQLSALAPARLLVLDGFLRQHPGHADARRDRFALQLARMPRPDREALLIEDAARAGIPLPFGPDAPWIRNLSSWQAQARRQLPDLEAALRRWPGSAALWRQWVGWAAFLPGPPSALALAEGLPIFGSRAAWKSRLPAAAHQAIAAEFQRSRRLEAMADWYLEAWRVLVEGARELEPDTLPPEAQPHEDAIVEALRQALKALGRTQELQEVERIWPKIRRRPEPKAP